MVLNNSRALLCCAPPSPKRRRKHHSPPVDIFYSKFRKGFLLLLWFCSCSREREGEPPGSSSSPFPDIKAQFHFIFHSTQRTLSLCVCSTKGSKLSLFPNPKDHGRTNEKKRERQTTATGGLLGKASVFLLGDTRTHKKRRTKKKTLTIVCYAQWTRDNLIFLGVVHTQEGGFKFAH